MHSTGPFCDQPPLSAHFNGSLVGGTGFKRPLLVRHQAAHLEAAAGEAPGGPAACHSAANDGHGGRRLPLIEEARVRVRTRVRVRVTVARARSFSRVTHLLEEGRHVDGLGAPAEARHGHGEGAGEGAGEGRHHRAHGAHQGAQEHPEGQGDGHDEDLGPRLADEEHALGNVGLGRGLGLGAGPVLGGEPAHGQGRQPPRRLVRRAVHLTGGEGRKRRRKRRRRRRRRKRSKGGARLGVDSEGEKALAVEQLPVRLVLAEERHALRAREARTLKR